MKQTNIQETKDAHPHGSRKESIAREINRLRLIDQLPTKRLRVKAMLVQGWSTKDIIDRCDCSRIFVHSCLKELLKPEEFDNVYNYLKEIFADNSLKKYKLEMDEVEEIAQILSGWDRKAVSKLAEDLRSGKLTQHYAAAAEPEKTIDRSSPPDGQLYADRPDRKETAPQFIERVYGGAGWLTGNFTRADLRKIDPQAATGLNNWESNNKQRANLNLPTVKERNDRQTAPDGVLTDEAKQSIRIAERLRSATRRRLKNQKINRPRIFN